MCGSVLFKFFVNNRRSRPGRRVDAANTAEPLNVEKKGFALPGQSKLLLGGHRKKNVSKGTKRGWENRNGCDVQAASLVSRSKKKKIEDSGKAVFEARR